MDESPLLALPDDALLAVLAYLPPRELFSCRVLCRRLRDLCLHRDLWRRVRLDGRDHTGLVRAAIRLAPCLRALDLTGIGLHYLTLDDAVAELSRTECVIAKLTLKVIHKQDVARAAALLPKLSSLGGLSELSMRFVLSRERRPMVVSMCGLNNLHDLEIVNESKVRLLASSRDFEGRPSVEVLRYTSISTRDSFLNALLKIHAATLDRIYLHTKHVPVSSLKALPKLRSLIILDATRDDLSELKFCPNLISLHFVLPCVGALQLLRRAPRLRFVTVPFFEPNPAAPLLALAASRSARVVEVLRVNLHVSSGDGYVQLAAALFKFPSLRTLTLEFLLGLEPVHFKVFCQAISPTNAPRLTMLEIPPPLHVCPHAWLHECSVGDLLKRNPRLHLRVRFPVPFRCTSECQWCPSGCHSDLTAAKGAALGAHAREAECPRDCYRWP